MNRCKLEDFADCYVDGSDKEISRAFQERLFSLGAKWLDFNDQTVRFNSEMTHICFDGSRVSWNSREYAVDNYSNEIEMEDLKPKPTKFVKVEESIFDLKGEFERGELYMKFSDEYVQIPNETQLSMLLDHNQCWRKVEKEIEERQEFVDRAKGMFVEGFYFEQALEKMYDAGCRFQD